MRDAIQSVYNCVRYVSSARSCANLHKYGAWLDLKSLRLLCMQETDLNIKISAVETALTVLSCMFMAIGAVQNCNKKKKKKYLLS